MKIDTDLSHLIQKKSQNELVIKQTALCHMEKYNQYTAIYTDGSKEQEKTACAFVTAEHVSTYRLPDESDIIEAELQAIVMAGQHLVDHPDIKKAVLFTDSLTALNLLSTSQQHDYALYTNEIMLSNRRLQSNGTDLVLVWVPAHVGIPGNEAADQQAKLGQSLPANRTNNKLQTINYCHKKSREWLLEAWQMHYDRQHKALHYKQVEPKVTIDIKYTVKHRRTEAWRQWRF